MNARLRALFLLALVAVLAAVGLVVGSLLGPIGAVTYAVLALVGLLAVGVLAAQREKLEKADAAAASGHSCTCCAASQHDPVKVV